MSLRRTPNQNKFDSRQEIKNIYKKIRPQIKSRLAEFKRLFKKGTEEDVFGELVFCILTPQSKAQNCWECVENLKKDNLILKGEWKDIVKKLNKARFKNKKAEYIVEARNKSLKNGKLDIKSQIAQFENAHEAREWLVNGTRPVRSPHQRCGSPNIKSGLTSNGVKGIGYKEASHFLRNIGFGEEIAILDRHILKNLKELGVIRKIPLSLSRKKYYEIEADMKEFSKRVNIPMEELDLVFWYKETGKIFK